MAKVPRETLRNIINSGLTHLMQRLGFVQKVVLVKMEALGCSVSAPSMSNIKNNKHVGFPTLKLAADGMELLMKKELDMAFNHELQDFLPLNSPGFQYQQGQKREDEPTVKMHSKGRVSVGEKTKFITTALHEVVEVGVRLNSFSGYFISENESAYKIHILELLGRGVHIKGYLLDPESEEARIYFEDRARYGPLSYEKDSLDEIRKVIRRFQSLKQEFEARNLPGSFEIYKYKHIPYCLYLAIDNGQESGKMMVSPYLYGVSRANCPVMEFSKAEHPELYRWHLESMEAFMDGAEKVI
jgi:hypothetical protein